MRPAHGEAASSRHGGPARGRLARLGAVLLVAACALPPAAGAPAVARSPEAAPPGTAPPEPEVGRPLSAEQHERLRAGDRVEELVELERRGERYVGGVAYVLVDAAPRRVFDVLNQLDTLSLVLPHTRNIRVIERDSDRVRVEIEQGNSVASTAFTAFFERAPAVAEDAHLVRFWLDPSQPHGIRDVWGFFRVTRYDAQRSVISVGALVNLGPGIIRMLFEQRIVRAILRTPERIRGVVERTPARGATSASRHVDF